MTLYTFPVTYTEGEQSVTANKTLSVYDAVVSELLFNGANGGTSFPDTSGRVWTAAGNAQTSTAQFDEGTASLFLDGAGDYLSTASTTDIQMSGDFRLEAWIRPINVTSVRVIAGKRPPSGTQAEFIFWIAANGRLRAIAWPNSATPSTDIIGATVLTANTGYDVALERIGETWRILVNGNLDAEGVQTANPGVNTQPLMIGRDQSTPTRDFHGYIDRFRFLRP